MVSKGFDAYFGFLMTTVLAAIQSCEQRYVTLCNFLTNNGRNIIELTFGK